MKQTCDMCILFVIHMTGGVWGEFLNQGLVELDFYISEFLFFPWDYIHDMNCICLGFGNEAALSLATLRR